MIATIEINALAEKRIHLIKIKSKTNILNIQRPKRMEFVHFTHSANILIYFIAMLMIFFFVSRFHIALHMQSAWLFAIIFLLLVFMRCIVYQFSKWNLIQSISIGNDSDFDWIVPVFITAPIFCSCARSDCIRLEIFIEKKKCIVFFYFVECALVITCLIISQANLIFWYWKIL